MMRRCVVLFVVFFLVGCSVPPDVPSTGVPPEVTSTRISPEVTSTSTPNITSTPTISNVTNTPTALDTPTSLETTSTPTTGPTVDVGDRPYLPNPEWQPGATNPDVNQSNIQSTICVSGYTSKIRPPASYTDHLKLQQIKQYGYADTLPADYEEDHLISLELGGAPKDPKNLWPQPRHSTPYDASMKDTLENTLHKMVCAGQLPLDTARQDIATDWVAAYRQYVGQSIIAVTAVPTEP